MCGYQHVCMCTMCTYIAPYEARKGVGVTSGYVPSSQCWESNLGLLQKHQVLLTLEPLLQPLSNGSGQRECSFPD